jgi:hypothetical protein
MATMSTMERIAQALARLGEVTQAVQNTSVAVTHVANHHEVLARGATEMAEGAKLAAGHLASAVGVAARLATSAERFVAVVETQAPRFVDAVVKLSEREK